LEERESPNLFLQECERLEEPLRIETNVDLDAIACVRRGKYSGLSVMKPSESSSIEGDGHQCYGCDNYNNLTKAIEYQHQIDPERYLDFNSKNINFLNKRIALKSALTNNGQPGPNATLS
jgi:hypothetical protein